MSMSDPQPHEVQRLSELLGSRNWAAPDQPSVPLPRTGSTATAWHPGPPNRVAASGTRRSHRRPPKAWSARKVRVVTAAAILLLAVAGFGAYKTFTTIPGDVPSVCAATCQPGQVAGFSVAALPPTSSAAASRPPAGAAAGTAARTDAAPATAAAQPTTSAAQPGSVRPQTPTAPVAVDHLVIPALGVDAPVTSAPVETLDGVRKVIPPDDVHQVAVMVGSASPTAALGTVTVVGHVNSKQQGEGALYQLADLQPGDTVYLNQGGVLTTWRINALTGFDKSGLPADLFAGPAGPRRLQILTCGGPFDATTGQFRDNTVATGIPA